MILSTVKQQHDDGFTLIEMLLVLVLISSLLVLFPLINMGSHPVLSMRMEYLKTRLLQIQTQAVFQKERKDIFFQGTQMVVDGDMEDIQLSCSGALSFNESGNVSRAMSIPCYVDRQSRTLVVQLGNGRMYVK